MASEALFMVPDNWEVTTLGEACNRGGGNIQTGPFGSQLHAADYVPVGIPSIMPENIGDNRIIIDKIARITQEDAHRLIRYRVREGDIVYSRRGDVERRALVRDAEEGWLCGTGCLRVRVGAGLLDPRFTSFYLGHPEVRSWIVRHAVGATMPNLNTSILSALPIVVPPREEQRRIAAFLSALDDKIDLDHRINKTAEALASAVFKKMFMDKVENDLPNGWTWSSLLELFSNSAECVLTGPFGSNLHASDYRDDGVPLILVKHVMEGRVLDEDLPRVAFSKAKELERYLLKVGDIVFTRVGAVGRTAYIHEAQAGWMISGQTLRVRVPNAEILNPRYLAQIYLELDFTAMVESHALGTTRPSLNTGILASFKFLYPPIAIQKKFAQLVEPLDKQREHNFAEIKTLTDLRDAFLSKLMSGEIRLKDAEKIVEAHA